MNRARIHYIIEARRLGFMSDHTAYKAVCAEHFKENPNHATASLDDSSRAAPVTCDHNQSNQGEKHANDQYILAL